MPPSDLTAHIDDLSSPPPAKTRVIAHGRTNRKIRALLDRLATGVVWVGGLATIVSIMGIFLYLFKEVAPLFIAPESESLAIVQTRLTEQPSDPALAIGIDQYQEVAYLIHKGHVAFFQIPSGKPIPFQASPNPLTQNIVAVAQSFGRGHHFAFGTDDGHVVPVDVELTPTFHDGVRTIIPSMTRRDPIFVDPTQTGIAGMAYQDTDTKLAVVMLSQSGELWFTTHGESEGLVLSDEPVVTQTLIAKYPEGEVTTFILDSLAETLMVGTKDGRLLHWNLQDPSAPELSHTYLLPETAGVVTALSFLIGDRSLAVGTNKGTVSIWMPVPSDESIRPIPYQLVRSFKAHSGAVTQLSPSRRDKGFLSADVTGQMFLHHSTSSQTLLEMNVGSSPVHGLMFAPKANGAVAFNAQGKFHAIKIDNAHPEITANTLFRPVLYEGYARPEYIWQSSSGSDEFEPKFGMWPLIFGTLKGTIYAMLLAVPLAVMGAVYTGMFMTPQLRAVIKPIIEIMAALPSVVLGFLAGLWLAPLLEQVFPAVVAMMFLMPVTIAVACIGWQFMPRSIQIRGQSGIDLGVLTLVLFTTIIGCLAANSSIEAWLFNADYKQWFRSVFDLHYDQRNALVISMAMGFAVIPIIFSISEDSISNVPKHLIAGSLAMGATQWQTLTRLVLISASPGIFSALMIGFGRAVGETMIVLMATGNTPILDWSLFNGFRTLSANIAVEMPEAPHGGTLYRILFLSGLLLFAFTFFINTIAEIVRQRLRAKYSQY
ncbi:MAG: phosphate ABC transporter permease [Nitrospirales bacterium]|nr:MAG: phosphate ABC transporter permease [Nitrospirales bacterium]